MRFKRIPIGNRTKKIGTSLYARDVSRLVSEFKPET